MKIFISWSGPRSRKVAEYLSGWLRKLPLTVRPWVSKEAIDPGTRWEKELSEALEGTTFGILCLTPENQLEPWICFEAGALSKTVEKTYVIPYLIDMGPNDLKQPLKQFQAIEANKDGTLKLIKTIHKASGDDAHSIEDIKETFDALWPKLEGHIETAKKEVSEPPAAKEAGFPEIKFELYKIVVLLESLSSRMTKMESQGLRKPPWLMDEISPTMRLSDVLGQHTAEQLTKKDFINYYKAAVDRSQSDSKTITLLQQVMKDFEEQKEKEKKISKTEKEES